MDADVTAEADGPDMEALLRSFLLGTERHPLPAAGIVKDLVPASDSAAELTALALAGQRLRLRRPVRPAACARAFSRRAGSDPSDARWEKAQPFVSKSSPAWDRMSRTRSLRCSRRRRCRSGQGVHMRAIDAPGAAVQNANHHQGSKGQDG
jgi:hypothetical protein